MIIGAAKNLPPHLGFLTEIVPPRLIARIEFTQKCWIWQGHKCNGYGRCGYEGRMQFVHRIFYSLLKGDFDPRLDVCHKCDTPACVNPAHLFLGTHDENMKDMVAKGRIPHGEAHRDAKLTRAQIEAIRNRYERGTFGTRGNISQRALAREYGVSRRTIRQILTGEIWKG